MEQNKNVLIIQIVQSLRNVDNWTGKTHIQKTTYLLQQLFGINTGYDFTLYKHGPYSFDLDAEIERLRIIGGLDYEIHQLGYGPRYKEGIAAPTILANEEASVRDAVEKIASLVQEMGVRDLECLSTLAWCNMGNKKDVEALTDCVRKLKPHLSDEEVRKSWDTLQGFLAAA